MGDYTAVAGIILGGVNLSLIAGGLVLSRKGAREDNRIDEVSQTWTSMRDLNDALREEVTRLRADAAARRTAHAEERREWSLERASIVGLLRTEIESEADKDGPHPHLPT